MNSTFGSFKRNTTQNGDLSVIFQKNPDMEVIQTTAYSGNILDELREPTHLRGITSREGHDTDFKRITEIDSIYENEESKRDPSTAHFSKTDNIIIA